MEAFPDSERRQERRFIRKGVVMNIHHEKAQHNPQNLEIYRFQCNQNQPTFHVLTFYFNKFHITHAYQFIYTCIYTGVKK